MHSLRILLTWATLSQFVSKRGGGENLSSLYLQIQFIMRSKQAIASITIVFFLILSLGWYLGVPKVVPNSDFYINMATGHAASVMKPFSSRILHPFLASVLIRSGLSVPMAFTVVAAAALALLFASISLLVRWFGEERPLWPFLLFCPILVEYFRTAYMNDLLHAALLGILLAVLVRWERASFPILLALIICRESTILVATVLAVYFVWRRKYAYAVGTFFTVVLGFLIVSWIAPAGGHNIHSLSTGAYIVEKTGWNFLANWLGLRLWRPTFEWACPAPLFQAKLPLLKADLVLCDWDMESIINTWTNFLGTISLTTAIVLASWKSLRIRLDGKRLELLFVIAAYGVLAAIVGTFTGTATHRLIGYGWPLIWVVVPVVFNVTLKPRSTAVWLFLHWLLMWVRELIPPRTPSLELLFCAAVIVLNVMAYRSISARFSEEKSPVELAPKVSPTPA